MREAIEQALDEYARPILREHCGEVEVTRIQGDTVYVRLLGQCAGCPAAAMTNETLIEGQLMPLLPDLKEVILVHTVDASLLAEARSLMTRARSRDQG